MSKQLTKTDITKLILSIVFGATAISVFLYANKMVKKKHADLNEFGITTKATLYETYGDNLKFHYSINGKTYKSGKAVPYRYLQKGEQYELLYDPNDYERVHLLFDKPIIPPNYLETTPLKIERKVDKSLRFLFEVKGEQITRICRLGENLSITPNNYIVKYDPGNPKIGYLIAK